MDKEKIKDWFKDKDNLILIGILVFALIIRLYYFFLTKNQPLWWDEAEYVSKAKNIVLGVPNRNFYFYGREMLVPLFWSLIYFIFRSEVSIKFVQVIVSVLIVLVTYYLGTKVYNKKIGLIGAAFMACFWMQLFFTCRALTYLYAPLFYTLAIALFWDGYYNKRNSSLYLAFVTVMIGTSVYSSVSFAIPAVILYLLIVERIKFLKDKNIWKGFFIGLPFLIVGTIPAYIFQGHPFPRLITMAVINENRTGVGISGIFGYLNLMPNLMTGAYFVFLILMLIIVIRIIFYFDLIIKKEELSDLKKDFFVFIMCLFPLGFYTYFNMTSAGESGLVYDAFILPSFPAMFILFARAISEIRKYLSSKFKKEESKKIIAILIFILFLIGSYQQLSFAEKAIKNKVESYIGIKNAGEWIKENSLEHDKVVASSLPQMGHYSERKIIPFNSEEIKSKEEFLKNISLEKPRYLVLTIWERSPEWAYSLPDDEEIALKPVQAYYLDKAQQSPDTIIYEIEY